MRTTPPPPRPPAVTSAGMLRLPGAIVLSILWGSVATAQPLAPPVAGPARFAEVWRAAEIPSRGVAWLDVRAIVEGPSDHLLVLDASAHRVVELDTRGRVVRSFGRRGSGPGELSDPRMMTIRGDTLFVDDVQNARLTAFSLRDGRVLAHDRFRDLYGAVQLSPRGSFLVREGARQSMAGRSLEHVHLGASAKESRVLARYELPARHVLSYRLYQSDERGRPTSKSLAVANTMHPLVDQVHFAHAPDGEALWLISPSSGSGGIFAQRGGALTIRRVRPTGQSDLERRFTATRRALVTRELDALIDSLANPPFQRAGVRPVPNRQEIIDSLGQERRWPAVMGARVGSDGTLWLQQPPTWGEGPRFWRIAGDGAPLAPVAFPRGFTLFGANGTEAWGTLQDDAGDVVIVKFRQR